MRKTYFSSMLFGLLAGASVLAHAATATPAALASPAPASTVSAPVQALASINLNTADAETLKRELSGVGMAKAEAIVKHRETNGSFLTIDELLEVKGIGKALLDRNRDRLTVQ